MPKVHAFDYLKFLTAFGPPNLHQHQELEVTEEAITFSAYLKCGHRESRARVDLSEGRNRDQRSNRQGTCSPGAAQDQV